MTKIVLIGNTAGSLINFRKELIIELVKQSYIVYCLVSDYSDETKAIIETFGAIPIDSTLNSKGINPLADIKATYELSHILKELKPDVVFSYFVKPVIFGTFAAKLAKVPKVIGMIEGLGNAFTPKHADGFDIKTRIIQRVQIFLYKSSLPLLDTLIVLNPDDRKDLIDQHKINVKNPIVLGGIGVDLKQFNYAPVLDNQFVTFMFVARLLREKGVFEYLEAASKVKKFFPDAKFYILGSFDEQNPFGLKKTELNEYLASGIVEYPGHVSNVSDYLINSSVFVLPSFYREGVPRSTQEAMAIGRPIITTDVPGCRETVRDGVNGFLIPPFNSEALADAMMKFIEDPSLINKMGRESRKMAETKYNIDDINAKLIKLIESD